MPPQDQHHKIILLEGQFWRHNLATDELQEVTKVALLAMYNAAEERAEKAEALLGEVEIALQQIEQMPYPGAPDIAMRKIAREALQIISTTKHSDQSGGEL